MRRALWLAALALGACGQKLPLYSEVEDLRVLGIRARVAPAPAGGDSWATALLDRPADFAAVLGTPPVVADTSVTFDALALDPRGGQLDYTWSFCPLESSKACTDFDELLLQGLAAYEPARARLGAVLEPYFPTTEELATALRAARDLRTSGSVMLDPNDPLAPAGLPTFTVALDQPVPAGSPYPLRHVLWAYFGLVSFYGYGLGAWPSVILELRRGDESLLSEKRVVMIDADLPGLARTLELFGGNPLGVSFCATPEQSSPPCLFVDARLLGNKNPELGNDDPARTIEWSAGKSALATWEPLPLEPLAVRRGESVRLLPHFTTASFEPYQLLRTDLNTRRITVEDATEEPSVSWFVSAGRLQDQLTWPPFTKTLDTVYTPPAEPPANGHARLWLVGRDQRGGETWTTVDLSIE